MHGGFVLDASIALAWCFTDEKSAATDDLLERLHSESGYVPALWALEITSILLMAERKKRISYATAVKFMDILLTLPIEVDLDANGKLSHEILLLAHTEKLTSYDAAYLELALRKGLPLASKDKALQAAADRLGLVVLG